jgi:hypothetical protein
MLRRVAIVYRLLTVATRVHENQTPSFSRVWGSGLRLKNTRSRLETFFATSRSESPKKDLEKKKQKKLDEILGKKTK